MGRGLYIPLLPRRRKLHIPRFAASGKAHSFRCSSFPHKISDFAGSPVSQSDFAFQKSCICAVTHVTKSACPTAAEKCLSTAICPHSRWRSQPLSRVSRKQRYNTLDFPTENRVPTGMLRAPIGSPASKGIFPSELPIFSSQTGTQTVKTQFGTPAQKMQKEVRTDEWRTSFFADNLKSLRYSFRLSAPARGHDA